MYCRVFACVELVMKLMDDKIDFPNQLKRVNFGKYFNRR